MGVWFKLQYYYITCKMLRNILCTIGSSVQYNIGLCIVLINVLYNFAHVSVFLWNTRTYRVVEVAVKVLKKDQLQDLSRFDLLQKNLNAFKREAKLMAQLYHQNVLSANISTYDCFYMIISGPYLPLWTIRAIPLHTHWFVPPPTENWLWLWIVFTLLE